MLGNRLAGVATIGVGAALMLNAVLGPLVLSVIRYHESAGMETQLLGGETVSLFLAGPLAIVAGLLWYRGNLAAPAVAIAPLGYAIYTYIQLVLVPDYARYEGNNERFFPLFLLAIVGSWILTSEAWRELQMAPLPTPSPMTARLLGASLVAVNIMFAAAWCLTIAAFFKAGPSLEYREHPTAFWLIRLMDLGFIIPIGLATGVGLLARSSWAPRLAYAFTGTQTLLGCAVTAMAFRMWIASDASMNGVAVVALTSAAGALVLFYNLLIWPAASFGR